jgi:hypothetical protein
MAAEMAAFRKRRPLGLMSYDVLDDEQQWQESGWNGASVLQETPHLRQLPPPLDGSRNNAVR